MRSRHRERHQLGGTGWLRAAVLGANDGIVSTASLLLGVAAAHASHANLLISGVAGLVAGAMSMATGEYVSVRAQADSEAAAIAQESAELKADYIGERGELVDIYRHRGLDDNLAAQVAEQLMAHDALGSHTRDELGLLPENAARPVQAAVASAASYATGAALPLAVAVAVPAGYFVMAVVSISLSCLLGLGIWSARVSGAAVARSALRVTAYSALAMAVTTGVGALFGTR